MALLKLVHPLFNVIVLETADSKSGIADSLPSLSLGREKERDC